MIATSRARQQAGFGRSLAITARILAVLLLTGCAPYELRGKVVSGPASAVHFVKADDAKLAAHGLAEATVELTLDPQSLARKVLATRPVEPDGTFKIPIREFGAGWLEHEVGLVVRAPGHDSAVEFFRLPAPGQRVLVTLATGPDRYRPRDDLLKESQQFLRD